MADSQDPNPEEIDLAEGEQVIVDALTGEVTTLSADEIAAEEAAEQPAAPATAVADVPDGISPELVYDPFGEEPLPISKEEFESLLSQFSSDFQEFREGEIVKARVLSLTDTVVILEFGFKSEGSVALDEFKEAPEAGSEVEVLLESLEDDDGVVVLSKKKADFLRVWEKILTVENILGRGHKAIIGQPDVAPYSQDITRQPLCFLLTLCHYFVTFH